MTTSMGPVSESQLGGGRRQPSHARCQGGHVGPYIAPMAQLLCHGAGSTVDLVSGAMTAAGSPACHFHVPCARMYGRQLHEGSEVREARKSFEWVYRGPEDEKRRGHQHGLWLAVLIALCLLGIAQGVAYTGTASPQGGMAAC